MTKAEEMRKIADEARKTILEEQKELARTKMSEFLSEIEREARNGKYSLTKVASTYSPDSLVEMLDFLVEMLVDCGFSVEGEDCSTECHGVETVTRTFIVSWGGEKND